MQIYSIGVIQIIRDTLGGGFDEVSHKPFLYFKSPFLMLLEVKTFEWQLVYVSKSTFFLIPIEVQKWQKSVTYYLNGRL
jgi:hypothetical protein